MEYQPKLNEYVCSFFIVYQGLKVFPIKIMYKSLVKVEYILSILQSVFKVYHSVHWGINLPEKTPPSLFAKLLLNKSAQCSSLLFRQSPYTLFFHEHPPPPKNDIFQ